MIDSIKKIIDKKPYIILCIVLVLQIALIIFWGCMKSNFHQDELFSLESAHYINDSTPRGCYMHESELFSEKTWLDVGEFRKLLTVDEESSILLDKPERFVYKFILGRSYMILLNIAMDVISPGEISKWPGIIMNIPFFILMQICLYKVIYGLTEDRKASILYICAYGFSSISLGFGIYTRFYCYALMMIAIAIYLHYKIWFDDKKIVRNIIFEITSLLCFIQAFRGSELVAVITLAWFGCFALALAIKKRWKSFIIYISPAVAGAVFLMRYYSHLTNALLNPTKYMDGSGQPLDIMFTNAVNLGIRSSIRRIYYYFQYLGESLFGNLAIFIAFVLVTVILTFLYIKDKNRCKIPLKSESFGFGMVIFGMVVIYSIFSIVVGLWLPRYYALMYPQLLMLIVLYLRYLLKNTKTVYNYIVMGIFAIGILFSNISVDIDNVYLEDREAIAEIQTYDAIDNVIWNLDDFQIILECTYLVDEESRMYVVSENEELNYDDFSDELLLWTCVSEPLGDDEIVELHSNGYDIVEYLGVAADANIYYCKKAN